MRGVANYLSTQTSFGGVRDKFTRLHQIASVLNMEEDSEEFFSNSAWRLSRQEYNTILERLV